MNHVLNLNPLGETCAWCGCVATGMARIGRKRYCHGDDDTEPTCYMQASWAQTRGEFSD